MHPEDTLTKHFRLSPIQLRGLKKLGITTVHDLLYHFPARYDQGGEEAAIQGLVAGSQATIFGTIGKLDTRRSWKRKIPVGEAVITDASGSIKVMWFHQPYLAKKFSEGQFVKAVGTVGGKDGKPYLANPHVEVADPTDVGLFASAGSSKLEAGSFFAVYPETRGVTSLWFRHAFEKLYAANILDVVEDPIPADIVKRYNLPDIESALLYIHKPDDLKHAEAARKRFAFEEIFAIQIARAKERSENDTQASFPILNGEALAEKFLSTIPFPPTGAQRRAIAEILADFGKQHPMARLLEGDVGAGKTLVAAATAYAAVNSRPPNRQSGTLQVAYMAPTEILAAQHFQSFIEYFSHLPINIALMTGSGSWKFPSKTRTNTRTGRGQDADEWRSHVTNISRSQLLKWVENGEIAMVIGTHALIQKSVRFQNLAYVIIDEQHRFGVSQRKALARGHERGQNAEKTRTDAVDPLLYRDLTYRIREAVFKVRKELGTGHKEVVYQRALAEAFTTGRLSFSKEIQIPVLYQQKKVGTYVPDFVVEDKIIVELKALPYTGPKEKKQLWHYLKGSAYRVGLLINFGIERATIDRVVYDIARLSASGPRMSASLPHFLSMTATPIPRTLALTMYGDLDISLLDELPPGRAKITTTIVKPSERANAYERVREQLRAGRQAFVICPRIEEPDPAKINALQAKSAKAEAKRLQKDVFPEYRIGLLHGSVTPHEKDKVMAQFAAHEIDILVATSVVEVGINVPNATVMMIEGAERFGLAQLHQLRGRVMRSSHPPVCFLVPETKSETSMKRLRALEKSDDGFKLAEADLENRGAGDLFGRKQWGVSDLGMEALKNIKLIRAARDEAQALVAKDSTLSNYPALAQRVANAGSELHGE